SLGIGWRAFHLDNPPTCGTTNVDFSGTLIAALQQLRGYRPTRFQLTREPASPAGTAGITEEVLNKQLNVPDSWLRGFLQVQSAATFPLDVFQMAPIDFYNVLRQLRLNGDRKGEKRGLRIELVPGEPVRLVLEPWDVVVPSTSGIFKGKVP